MTRASLPSICIREDEAPTRLSSPKPAEPSAPAAHPRREALMLATTLLALFIATPSQAADPPPSDTPPTRLASASVPNLVKILKHPDSATRSRAAETLRNILAGNPAARHNDHGRPFWEDKIRATLPGMTKADALKLLPPDPPVKDFSELPGHGSGDSHNVFYRLDDYWEVALTFRNTDRLFSTPTLRQSARRVYVAAPKDFTGLWTTYFVNGQKSHDIQYKNGKYNGPFTTYHDDGSPSVQQHYTNQHANGTDTGHYKSGQRMYEGHYENDLQTGLWTHWYDTGQLQQTVSYKSGQRHGQYTSYYPTGQKHHQVMYQNGLQHGPDTCWDEQGKILWFRQYKNGKLVE